MFGDAAIRYTTERREGLRDLLLDWAGRLERYAQWDADWTDRSGDARRKIHAGVDESGNKLTVYLAHGVFYGAMLERGTRPHRIKAKDRQALSWREAWHPVKKVRHPGTRAQPIIGPTVDANIGRIKRSILDHF